MSKRPISPAVLVAERLGKTFPGRGRLPKEGVVAIEDFNLSVVEQEILCIVGPSGCGKSTFLYIVAGFTVATSGRLDVYGKPVGGPSPGRGFVFQQAVLHWQGR